MKHRFILLYMCIFACSVSACSRPQLSAPACRTVSQTLPIMQVASGATLRAACIITAQSKLLVIQRSSGQYDLPYSNNLSNNAKTSAQCSAHRKTWQQTRLNVEVGRLLDTSKIIELDPQGNKNTVQIHLYACSQNAGLTGLEPPFTPPLETSTDDAQVDKLLFIDPFEIEQDQWRHPERFTQMRRAFVAHN
ncbi:hypothetical protein PN836_009030 [Ningiella sp. W23]|uniref:hypothetical protein n=1 Tax=Ningiella sp. W23 TaxID=3023715 RepID=UPI003756370B